MLLFMSPQVLYVACLLSHLALSSAAESAWKLAAWAQSMSLTNCWQKASRLRWEFTQTGLTLLSQCAATSNQRSACKVRAFRRLNPMFLPY